MSYHPCVNCDGQGYIECEECKECDGTGVQYSNCIEYDVLNQVEFLFTEDEI